MTHLLNSKKNLPPRTLQALFLATGALYLSWNPASQALAASAQGKNASACTAWYNELKLNMAPVPMHPLMARFIRNHKFALLKLAETDSQALILFKEKRLPKPGESIESRIDLDQLSKRLFILQRKISPFQWASPWGTLGAVFKPIIGDKAAIYANNQVRSFLNVGPLYELPELLTNHKESFYIFEPSKKTGSKFSREAWKSTLFEPVGEFGSSAELKMLYPHEGWRYEIEKKFERMWVIGEKIDSVTLLSNEFNAKAASPAGFLIAPESGETPQALQAAKLIREKARAQTASKAGTSVLGALEDLRQAQRKLLQDSADPASHLPSQLQAIRNSQDSGGVEQVRAINLYAREVRDENENLALRANQTLEALAGTYGEVKSSLSLCREVQKNPDPSALSRETAKLGSLREKLLLELDEIGATAAALHQTSRKISEAHELLKNESRDLKASSQDAQFHQSLELVKQQLPSEAQLGSSLQNSLVTYQARIPEMVRNVEETITQNQVLSSGRQILRAQSVIEKTAKALRKPISKKPSKALDRSLSGTPYATDLVSFLENHHATLSTLSQQSPEAAKVLDQATHSAEALEDKIALVTPQSDEPPFHLFTSEASLEKAMEDGKLDQIWVIPASEKTFLKKNGFTHYSLDKYIHLPHKTPLPHRTVWEIQKLNAYSNPPPKFAVFEAAKLRDFSTVAKRLTWLHEDLLDSSKTPGQVLAPSLTPPKPQFSAIELKDQVQLIRQGDSRSLAFYAFEEKNNLTQASRALELQLAQIAQGRSDHLYSGLTEVMTDRLRLDQQVIQTESARERLAQAMRLLDREPANAQNGEVDKTRDHLESLLVTVDTQISASKVLSQKLGELENALASAP